MSIFDLSFLIVAFLSIVTLLIAAGYALYGRVNPAGKLFALWLKGIVIYAVIVVASSLLMPRRKVTLGEPLCFDDWCISVDSVTPTSVAEGTTYDVEFHIFSRARGITQRENNVVMYLVDAAGRRFDPIERDSDVPFNVQLGPGESVDAKRRIEALTDTKGSGLVIAHEERFPITWFIIGAGPFEKSPVLWLTDKPAHD